MARQAAATAEIIDFDTRGKWPAETGHGDDDGGTTVLAFLRMAIARIENGTFDPQAAIIIFDMGDDQLETDVMQGIDYIRAMGLLSMATYLEATEGIDDDD